MTAMELRDIFDSSEFRLELKELSSYLASIKQERPIIYSLAKCLWGRGVKFKLEGKKKDVVVGDEKTNIEFKYNFDCDIDQFLRDELEKYGADLGKMWLDVNSKVSSKTWSVMAPICKDACLKEPDIFVWKICSRDLSNLDDDRRSRICWEPAQRKYDARFLHSDRGFLNLANNLLTVLKRSTKRVFSVQQMEIDTTGDFPSTYHFFICDFAMRDVQ